MAPAAVGRAGQKRPADDELDGEQPLTKRLGLLHIGPRDPSANGNATAVQQRKAHVQKTQNGDGDGGGDAMLLDDTDTTVYIHDLESEIAAIEADEENREHAIQFIPEIEKEINGIPKRLLHGRGPAADVNTQLVLYREPAALSIPEEQDSVRRAIAEARQRSRDKAALAENTTRDIQKVENEPIRLPFSTTAGSDPELLYDDDMMDID